MASVYLRGALAVALSTTALTVISTPAFAQAAPSAADEQAAEPADSGAIIVTARRRSETLQQTPVAITAVNTAMLENKAAVNIGDLQGAAPGLLITQQNSGAQAANISIRGLTYADIEKSQTPTVGVVVDGITIGTNTGQLQDAFDIAQIEVLRGPQGTLFGANTIGGVINITRTKPTMEPGGKAEFTYGRWNTWSGKAIVNYGNGDTWGIKGWYFHNETDGFYHNVTRNTSDGWSKGDSYGASLLFKPAGSGFNAQLTVENVVQSFNPVVSNIAKTGEVFCAFEPAQECNRNTTTDLYTTFGAAAKSKYRAPNATLEMNYDAGAVKLTSITGWRHSKEGQTQDFDGSSTDLYYVDRRQHYTQWSQELRASGNLFDGFDYVVGGYFFSSKYDLTQWSRVFGFDPNTPPTLFDRASQHVEGKTKSYAVFGDFNWAFADNWRLSFGGRWSHDNKKLVNGFAPNMLIAPGDLQQLTYVAPGSCTGIGAPTAPGTPVCAPGTFALVGAGDANFTKFTPKVGIDYRPNSDTMLYASWSRGYRSGGFSPRAATAATASTPFRPETVDSYEIGAKLALLDRKLEINIAGYVSDYKNMQQNLTVPGGPTGNQTVTGNVPGGASIKGIEIDGSLRVTRQLRITASGAYMKSHFRNFIADGVLPAGLVYPGGVVPPASGLGPYNYSANNLIYAPKFTTSLAAEYEVPTSFGSVQTSIGWRHISPYDEQLSVASTTPANIGGRAGVIVNGNDPRVRTTTQDLVDASLTVKFDLGDNEAYVRVFGRNLANEKTTTHAFTVAGLWSFGMALEPRTYGATIGVKF
ncbi:TonB-dependent receptor [Sphingobium subterraneum]|uniref:Iron complex outermembrane receptor protein n=1 Tax=Sphingobium subterraneum TaxID=627688 RepID=A0A841J3C4_9SPHN|nr:TonB-dependent receptor [Sphingobium subterraneum]MBB6124016.1 iron complex outermembrane receptor protein [Sphingobium subterraneum]